MKNIGSHFFFTLIGQVLTMLQGIIVMPIAIRNGGVATYGAFIIWQITLSLVFAVSYFGVGYSYRRNLASTTNPLLRRELFEPQFTYQLLTLGGLCLVMIPLNGWLAELMNANAEYMPAWVPISWLVVHFIYFQVSEYFRYTVRFDQYNIINASIVLLSVILIVSWVAEGQALTLTSLLLLTSAAKIAVSVPWAIAMLREIGRPKMRLPLQKIAKDIMIGWPLLLDTIFTMALGFGDRYLIVAFLSVADVGRYQPAYQLAYLLIFIPKCGEIMLPPVIARMMDSGDAAGAERATSEILSFFLMIAIPYALGAIMIGPSIVALLANEEAANATVWVSSLVVVGTVFYGITLLGFQAAYVLGKTRLVVGANLIGAALNIGLNIALLPLFRNLTAAAIASLVSYGITCGYVAWELRSIWRFHVDWQNIARYIAASITMTILLWIAGLRPAIVQDLNALQLLRYIGLGTLSYFSALWLIGGIKVGQLAQLKDSLLRRS